MNIKLDDKVLLKTIIALGAVIALLLIGQVWGIGPSVELLIKIIVTLGLVMLILAMLMLGKNEIDENKHFKDKDLID